MFPKLLSYRAWAVIFTVFSFGVSNIGLSSIIRYSIPVLMLIYPPAIVLILLALTGKLFEHDRRIYRCVTAFTWAAAVFDFFKTLPEGVQTFLHLDQAVELAGKLLPLFNLNLGWVVPAVTGLMLGILFRQIARERR